MNKRNHGGILTVVVIIVAIVAALAAVTLLRNHDEKKPEETTEGTTPSAPAGKVDRGNLSKAEVIPAEFRAYVAVELNAKVTGYVKDMNVDFGDRVKAGQLLATIEVPELHDQLNNAIADEQRAEANLTNASLIYNRLTSVNKEHPGLVAQQDIDTATSKDLEAQSSVSAAAAEVGRYKTLVAYTQIVAPFDGIVTHRYVDPGALVQAGTSSSDNGKPILQVSDNYLLRLDFPVSVKYVEDIHVGDMVSGTVESLGGKSFSGKITRATWQVDDSTRTMTTEIEVTNGDLTLVPGMYTTVNIPVDVRTNVLTVPIEAIPPGQTNNVYVINSQNEIEDRPVKLGIGTPDKYEVISGLKEGELVLTGNRSRFHPGEKVVPKMDEAMSKD